MSQNSKYQIRLPIVLCLGLAAGVFVGATLNTGKPSADVNKDVQKFREILTQIKEEYVDTVNTGRLVDDARDVRHAHLVLPFLLCSGQAPQSPATKSRITQRPPIRSKIARRSMGLRTNGAATKPVTPLASRTRTGSSRSNGIRCTIS